MHCDKHIVKMPLETAQVLSTAHRVLDGTLYHELSKNGRKIKRWKLDDNEMEATLYKATHVNHPSSVWARETAENYKWLYSLFIELCEEYTHRYGKTHKSHRLLKELLKEPPKNIKSDKMTFVPQAMPDHCKMPCSIDAYRNYYIKEKSRMLKYKNREIPSWIK